MSESSTFPPELAKALRKARNAAQGVEKKGKSTDGFDFVRSADIDAEAQRLLKLAGLIVVPVEAVPDVKFGKAGTLVHVSLSYEVVHVKSGESKVMSWAGAGFDSPGDKALFKGMTGGRKYFLSNLLGIPFGVDPEEDAAGADEQAAEAESIAEVDFIDSERVTELMGRISELQLPISQVRRLLNEVGDREDVPPTASAGEVLSAIKTLPCSVADEFETAIQGATAPANGDAVHA